MRFVPGWDEKMLTLLAACDSPDPVLTVCPLGYTLPDRLHKHHGPMCSTSKASRGTASWNSP